MGGVYARVDDRQDHCLGPLAIGPGGGQVDQIQMPVQPRRYTATSTGRHLVLVVEAEEVRLGKIDLRLLVEEANRLQQRSGVVACRRNAQSRQARAAVALSKLQAGLGDDYLLPLYRHLW